jgi:hypothetical protein
MQVIQASASERKVITVHSHLGGPDGLAPQPTCFDNGELANPASGTPLHQ